jgi:hypothetical protein
MNERIKLLAKQAGFGLRRDGEIYTSRLEHLPITEDLAKFAELIINECSRLAESKYKYSVEPNRWDSGFGISCDILEHFGVEE